MANSLVVKILADTKEFAKGLKGVGSVATEAFKGVAVATAGVSAAITAVGATILKTGASFEAAMSEVQALSGATSAELELLQQTAKDYGASTQFSATQAAEALKYMALAGWDAATSTDALGGVLNLAAAGGVDLAKASDMVTDYLSAFGLAEENVAENAKNMANMMAYAQANSNTSAEQLGEAYSSSATNMAAAGQTMETTTALLMGMADVGEKGAAAGTALSAVMASLTQKMKNGAVTINGQRIAVQDANGDWRDMIDILYDVSEATYDLGSTERSAALSEVFNRQSLTAVNTIFAEGIDKISEYAYALQEVDAGYAADTAATMMDNLSGAIKTFGSAMEGLQLTVYDSVDGIARTTVDGATDIINQINNAMRTGFTEDAMDGILNSVFALAGDVGGQVSVIFDKIVGSLVNLVPKLLPTLTAGIGKLINSVASKIPDLMKNVVSVIPGLLDNIGELVPGLIDGIMGGLEAVAEGIIANLPDILWSIIKHVPDVVGSLLGGIAKTLVGAVDALLGTVVHGAEYNAMQLDAELTYDVSTSADVDNSGAEEKADQALTTFTEYLGTLGMTTGEIAELLAFKGTESELQAELEKNYPNFKQAEYDAIINRYKTATLAEALQGAEGDHGTHLTYQQISDILGFVTADDYDALEGYLEENCPDLKGAALQAIESTWNNSSATLGAGTAGASMGLGVQLIVDLLTDGLSDDNSEVSAAMKVAKGILDRKKQELIDYIDNGGEDVEGATSAIGQIEAIETALDDYAVNYAGASTQVCAEQGAVIMEMVQNAQSAVDAIIGQSERMVSYQERLFNAGKSGEKLSEEDLAGATSYIAISAQNQKAEAEQAKQDLMEAGATYTAAEEWFQEEIARIDAETKQNTRELMEGQIGEEGMAMSALESALSSLFEGGTLSEIRDENNRLTVDDVSAYLQSIGYSSETINKAMDIAFGGEQTGATEFIGAKIASTVDQYDFGQVGDAIEGLIEAGILDAAQYGGKSTNEVIAAVLATDGSEAKTAGADAGSGFVSGLESKRQEIMNKASEIAKAAVQAMREALDEHSPSKVTQQIGEFAGQGFDIGISDSLRAAVNSARSIVGDMNLAPSLGLDGVTEAVGGIGSSVASSMNGLGLYVNGRLTGQVMAADNNSAMNAFQRRLALGVGRG